MNIEDLLECLNGNGLVITNWELIKETLEKLDLSELAHMGEYEIE